MAVYRVLTSSLFHNGVLHLLLNMLTIMPIGRALERALGTAQVRLVPS